ncbi:MAG: hypothetical protein ACR2P6_10625, partial [Gammaproteobacteria bacterium]
MKTALAIFLFAVMGSTQGAVVTFDDFPNTPGDTFPNEQVDTPQGFEFAQNYGDGGHIYTFDGSLFLIGQEQNPSLGITHASGNLFNLNSLDMVVSPDSTGGTNVLSYFGYLIQAFDSNHQL